MGGEAREGEDVRERQKTTKKGGGIEGGDTKRRTTGGEVTRERVCGREENIW